MRWRAVVRICTDAVTCQLDGKYLLFQCFILRHVFVIEFDMSDTYPISDPKPLNSNSIKLKVWQSTAIRSTHNSVFTMYGLIRTIESGYHLLCRWQDSRFEGGIGRLISNRPSGSMEGGRRLTIESSCIYRQHKRIAIAINELLQIFQRSTM